MKRIMLMADALFDTRLGTVLRLDPKVGGVLLGSQAYRDRDTDCFEELTEGAITKDAFIEAYKARDIETVKVSPYTNILAFIARMIGLYKDNADTMLEQEALVLVLNLWPYEFTRVEIDVLTELVNDALEDEIIIQANSMAPEEVTPEFLNTGYGAIVMYEFEHWLGIHQEAFVKDGHRCYGMDVLAPRLFQGDVTGINQKEKQRDIMRLQTALHSCFSLDFLEARWFSIYDQTAIAKLVMAMANEDDGPPVMLDETVT